MQEKILSVGIDIGTTTTQIVFSEIIMQNIASAFLLPNIKITEKRIIYQSKIYFTPLLSREIIDCERLKEIISEEYKKASINKDTISTGAVIITGETARKQNSEDVLNALSEYAGEFVVATAGPDLESILAGYGAGTCEYSKRLTSTIINYDVGGGTTNASIFYDGEVVDSFALDIGGRLIRFDKSGRVTYISKKIHKIIEYLELDIYVGKISDIGQLKLVVKTFAEIFLHTSENRKLEEQFESLFIEHLPKGLDIAYHMFSGGVAEYVYKEHEIRSLEDIIKYGDIGPLLGYSIKDAFKSYGTRLMEPKEKIRATVIGAGSHSIKISGSTVVYDEEILPMKNIPILRIHSNCVQADDIDKIRRIYTDSNVAVAFEGPTSPSYRQIKDMSKEIVRSFFDNEKPIIVITENDFAKALGQTIKNSVDHDRKVICIDKIKVDNGDYIDIGRPIADVVPVVIKTLILNT